MARGWESKDVESQMEEAGRDRRPVPPGLNPQEQSSARDLENLLLSRTRVLADMESAVNPQYRKMLMKSLQFLDEKLAEFSKPSRPE